MFMGFIYRHIQIGILYVNKPFYESRLHWTIAILGLYI